MPSEYSDNNVKQMKEERLLKKRYEEEKALIQANLSQSTMRKSKSMSKMSKTLKNFNNGMIKKEINYYLEYESPYAEYLVARYREWAPEMAQANT